MPAIPTTAPRPDASMSLLVDIASQALDPGYAAAARRAPLQPDAGRRTGVVVLVAVAATALLVAVAGVQAHLRAPAASRTRANLVAEVQRETGAVAALDRRVGVLRQQTTDLRNRLLASSSQGAALSRLLSREEVAAGTGSVRGPGLAVRLADSAGGQSGSGNRVLDRDVQSVVNSLWAAGAEAIAVNGQRLTSQSAIRQAGDAILVNFVPLSSPYVVDAVGDPVALETAFAASPTAGRMRTLAQLYGLHFGYARAARLTLAAAPGITLRFARPLPARHGGTS